MRRGRSLFEAVREPAALIGGTTSERMSFLSIVFECLTLLDEMKSGSRPVRHFYFDFILIILILNDSSFSEKMN